MILTSWPFHSHAVAAAVIVMPRSALLRHPVHDRIPVIDIAETVRPAGEEEHTLRHRRLAGVNVRNKPYVAYLIQGVPFRRLGAPSLSHAVSGEHHHR